MSDIKAGALTSENATLLLAAAEELGVAVHAVRVSQGAFWAPEEVVKKAGLGTKEKASEGTRTARATAKKAAAKQAEATPEKEDD